MSDVTFPVDAEPGSPERLHALDRMEMAANVGRGGKISELYVPEDPRQPARERRVLHQRLRNAAEDGAVLAVRYGIVILLWLGAGFLVGKAYVNLEAQQAQLKELADQMKTVGPQALRGQQAFQFLAANEKAMVALVNAENERLKKGDKKE